MRSSSWWYRATRAATRLQVGEERGTIFRRFEPDHRVDGQGRQAASSPLEAIAPTSDTVERSPRSDTQPRDDRRPCSDRRPRPATRQEQQRGGALNDGRTFGDTAPRVLGQLDQPMRLQRLQVVVHLLAGRPPLQRWQPTRFSQHVEDEARIGSSATSTAAASASTRTSSTDPKIPLDNKYCQEPEC